jgi:Spy/CpxP family protein refolding chaperone
MKPGWLIVLLLSLGINLGLGWQLLRGPAAPPAPPPGRGDGALDVPTDSVHVERFLGRRLDRLAARLDLSAPQREDLWRLHREDGLEILARRRELHRARAELQEALSVGEPTLAELQAAQRRLGALQADLDSVVVEIMYRERALMTPEQRQAYRVFFPSWRDGQRLRREPGAGRRGGPPERSEAP